MDRRDFLYGSLATALATAGCRPAPRSPKPGNAGRNPYRLHGDQARAANCPELARYVEALCPVPAGTFVLGTAGSPSLPAHNVTLGHFAMGRHPVTAAMWREYCDDTKIPMAYEPNWGWIDDHPVVNVSWRDVTGYADREGYADWASRKSGIPLRLPTEAEREYAARDGGSPIRFPWGNDWRPDSVHGSKRDGGDAGRTASVFRTHDIFENRFGIVDLSGNVWDWCWDRWGDYPPKDVTDPFGPETGESAVIRGGSWFCTDASAFECRCRDGWGFDNYSDSNGFRLVGPRLAGTAIPGHA